MNEKLKNYLFIGSGVLLATLLFGSAILVFKTPKPPAIGLSGNPIVLSPEELEGIGKININTADQADLEALSDVGPSTAAAILEYRTAHGSFKTIEDIMNVRGIGSKTFEKIKKYLEV